MQPAFPDATPDQIHLRILATSDLHVHLLPYDYYADKVDLNLGLLRTADLIAAARDEAMNCLLFDNGDFLQGNPMGDYVAQSGKLETGAMHPVFAAMNLLGYDAATLGNHEFNYGLDYLMTAIRGAAFPVVCANIATSSGAMAEGGNTLVPPYVMLTRNVTDSAGRSHSLRLGVIGFLPPQITIWDKANLEGRITTREIVAAAKALVPRMKAEGADLIIALSHSGIGEDQAGDQSENASTSLAAVAGIDAVVAGHTHLVFPSPHFAGLHGVDVKRGTIMGKPAVMPGAYGSHLGVIDLLLERKSTNNWQIVDHDCEARAINSPMTYPVETPDSRNMSTALEACVAPDHAATLAYARRPVGETQVPLNSFFATISPCASVALVAEAQRAYVATALRNGPFADLPVVSAASPFKTGGRGGAMHYTNIPAGPMALRHAADLYVFPNAIAALCLTGTELAEWLERAVGLYLQIQPNESDQPLIDPDFPSYNFDLIHGVSFQIDLSQTNRYDRHGQLVNPKAQRIRNLAFQGRPVTATQRFIVATNSYRASGSGNFPGAEAKNAVPIGRRNVRDVLLQHIGQAGSLALRAPSDWNFVPMPGSSVLFDTCPDASDEAAARGLHPLGLTTHGFARFRLSL